jgi:hypothetical protein
MMRVAHLIKFLAILAATWPLTGCKSDGDPSPEPPDVNSPPKISGNPTTKVPTGKSYKFIPAAVDDDGDALTFAVANDPKWARFNEKTGELTGTPGAAHVGRYEGVTISVSDGKATSTLPPFDIAVTSSAVNNPPVISGVPAAYTEAGSPYSFKPEAVDPEGDTISFTIQNKPGWATFEPTSGTLSGTPAAADVGTHSNISIAASDGESSVPLTPFSIVVVPAAAGSPAGDKAFVFAEVPEISFVQSFEESEHLGIYHLDATNRWSPGDLTNKAGWMPRVPTQLDVLQGTLNGLSYDATTGVLNYDGKGAAGWALVQLSAPSKGARSNPFYVRVLMPDAIWGQDATKRPDIAGKFPGVPKFDYGTTSYEAAWAVVPPGESPHDGEVLLILKGTYMSAVEGRLTNQVDPATGALNDRVIWRTNSGRASPWLYILGEPGSRPKISGYDVDKGGSLATRGYLVSVVKNLELETMITETANGGWQIGVPNRKYWTRIFAHSTHGLNRPAFPDTRALSNDVFGSPAYEGDTEDKTVRMGVPIAPNDFKSFFWNNEFLRTGGNSLKHTIYLHGRPDAWLIYNNNRHNGGNSSSAVKATLGHLRVLNSRISAFPDEGDPGDPEQRLNQQLIDVPSCSDSVIYNNHLIGGHRMVDGVHAGTRTGLIWFSPRRTLWGTDVPRYPDITFQAAPFNPFVFTFKESDVSGKDYPDAWLEIRRASGDWQRTEAPATFAPNASGGGFDWSIQLSEALFPVNGPYELRMSAGARQTRYPVQFNVYRNANYLAITSFSDARRDHPWYADGPKAYVMDDGAEYWSAMTRWGGKSAETDGRTDPTNPYTIKKFVSYNTFTWLTGPGLRPEREEAIRDNGTLPAMEFYSGSTGARFGAVPPNWVDSAVTFLLNNKYEGWKPEDLGTDDFLRNDVGPVTQNSANMLYGPGQDDAAKRNWPNYSSDMPAERRPAFVAIGGEKTPVSPDVPEMPLPAWFRIQ